MKSNVREHDMVQLCTDARMQAELQEGISVQVDFLTHLHRQLVQVDIVRCLWMQKTKENVKFSMP